MIGRQTRKGKVYKTYPVHEVFSAYDDKIWYDIPGFPGYQYCDQGYIRSFKSRFKFPYGVVLTFRHTGNGDIYQLTDRNNHVRSLSFAGVKSIVDKEKANLKPYRTFEVPQERMTRNKRSFIDQNIDTTIPGKVTKKPKPVRKESARMFHFTVAPDNNEPEIITPIHFVEVK